MTHIINMPLLTNHSLSNQVNFPQQLEKQHLERHLGTTLFFRTSKVFALNKNAWIYSHIFSGDLLPDFLLLLNRSNLRMFRIFLTIPINLPFPQNFSDYQTLYRLFQILSGLYIKKSNLIRTPLSIETSFKTRKDASL